MSSRLEREMANQIHLAGLPIPDREYRFHGTRRWRLDFAWPEFRLGIEVDGGTYTQGRHTRGAGYAADCEKLNTAALDGWMVLRVTREHIRSGQALAWVENALEARA